MQGPVDRKLKTLTTLIYSVAKERFGLEEPKACNEPPRRQTQIEKLRRELRQLGRRYFNSPPSEQLRLSQLRDTIRSQLDSLRKAENTKRKNRKRAKKRAAFTVIKKAGSGSAPGPNAIPYKVYKMCPLLLKRLWRLLKVVWWKGEVTEAWKEAKGIFTSEGKKL